MGYYFLNSKEDLTKELIGGKGYYLHQMVQDDLPIPEAAFISTKLWAEYRKNPEKTITKLKKEVIPEIIKYFKENNNGVMPLVSVRSAGAVSMPGMMDTILNVGVNQKYFKETLAKLKEEEAVEDKKNKSKKKKKEGEETLEDILNSVKVKVSAEEFTADTYARFLSMYGSTVLGIDKSAFPTKKFDKISDVEVAFDEVYEKHKKQMPSQKVEEQILDCVLAVFNSWDNDRAKLYRKINKINENAGTAVVIQRMVFGNKNNNSATGVLFSRDPSTGTAGLSGEYLVNAQGEDVVSGSHTPKNITRMKRDFPEAYDQLDLIADKLEKKYRQMQDIEFTIEDGKVFILQARTAKCSPFAKLKMLIDLYNLNEINANDVLDQLTLQEYLDLNIKQVDSSARNSDGKGLAASMGAMAGRVVFGPSYKYKDEPTIFVAKETTPDDLEAIQLATGILTASGGATSHAAVVARGMGKVCVVGCSDLTLAKDKGDDVAIIGGKKVRGGDWLTIDANNGKVWVGNDVTIVDASKSNVFWDLEKLVLESRPEWTRITSSVDDLIKDNKSYLLTYNFDEGDDDFLIKELDDAIEYITGTIDLTGKLDFLQQKYPDQFLFAEITAEQTFLRKKEAMLKISMKRSGESMDHFKLYLGPYHNKYAKEFRALGYKILDPSEVSFNKNDKNASIVITQTLSDNIPAEKIAISSKNALLSVLKR